MEAEREDRRQREALRDEERKRMEEKRKREQERLVWLLFFLSIFIFLVLSFSIDIVGSRENMAASHENKCFTLA